MPFVTKSSFETVCLRFVVILYYNPVLVSKIVAF